MKSDPNRRFFLFLPAASVWGRFRLFLPGVLLLAAFSCANPVAPEGGPRDETPPQVIPEESTPNLQTNFTKRPIELTFNEWVVLEDIFNQVVISPPLEFRPDVRLRRRTVIFEFDEREELRPEATYTINFGAAVKDLTEKNPAEGLRFVFSTGDFIDSLTVSGQIVDARTAEPMEGVLFMLYENQADSVVRTERPFYFAKTGKDGNFQINNVKSGLFKGFALKDNDLNYRFNQAGESIGFPDSLVLVSDSVARKLQIRLFTEAQPLRLDQALSDRYGLVRLAFNQPPYDLEIDFTDRMEDVYLEYEKDTVRVYYHQPDERAWNIFVRQDTLLNDTILVEPNGRADFLENAALKLEKTGGATAVLNPARPAGLRFNHPLRSLDTSLIRLYEDTLRLPVWPSIRIDSNDRRNLLVDFRWKEEMTYQLELLPGALTDWYGLANDTLARDYRADARTNYGTLTLVVEGLQPDTAYVLELRSGQDPKVAEYRVRNASSFEQTLSVLPPGQYVLTIITDLNDNGRWDTGSYDLHRQPEPYESRELEQLRANWEVESRVILGTPPATEEQQE